MSPHPVRLYDDATLAYPQEQVRMLGTCIASLVVYTGLRMKLWERSSVWCCYRICFDCSRRFYRSIETSSH